MNARSIDSNTARVDDEERGLKMQISNSELRKAGAKPVAS
jgi:hypothetical protein